MTSLIVWVRIWIIVAFIFSIKWFLFTLVSTRPVCLLMKSGFYLVFVISIIKWKVLLNIVLKVYLSVRTSLCSADNGSHMLVHFFSIKGENFCNSLSNLGRDILYMLKNIGAKCLKSR